MDYRCARVPPVGWLLCIAVDDVCRERHGDGNCEEAWLACMDSLVRIARSDDCMGTTNTR